MLLTVPQAATTILMSSLQQKGNVLSGILDNRFSAAGTVGYPSGIPQIDDVLLRQDAVQLLDGGQAPSPESNTPIALLSINVWSLPLVWLLCVAPSPS